MAAGSLADSLKCAICTEFLVDPRALPCGHSYCGPAKSCLNFIKHNMDQASKCAVCTQVFQVKVSDLNPLYGIRDAIGSLSVSDGKSVCGPECDHAKTLWCRDCNIPLCLPCVDSDHSDHSLTSYNTILKQQAKILLPELEDLDLQLSQVANEIKQLQLRQDELEKRARLKAIVKQTADGCELTKSPELIKFLTSKFIDVRQRWMLNGKLRPFEFTTIIENLLSQFNKIDDIIFSSNYHVREFNYRARAQLKKIDGEDWIALYLHVDSVTRSIPWKLRLEFKITLLNTAMAKNEIRGFHTMEFVGGGNNCWGWEKFKLHKDVVNFQNGFIIKPATLAVKIEIKNISLL